MNAYGLWIQRVQALALGLAFAGAALANADVEKLTADPKNWAMQAGDMVAHSIGRRRWRPKSTT